MSPCPGAERGCWVPWHGSGWVTSGASEPGPENGTSGNVAQKGATSGSQIPLAVGLLATRGGIKPPPLSLSQRMQCFLPKEEGLVVR